MIHHYLSRRGLRSRIPARPASLLAATLQLASVSAQNLPGAGNAHQFNGSTRINAGNAPRGISNQLTAEAWIRTTATNLQFAVTKYSNSLAEESGFQLGTSGGRAAIFGRAGAGGYYSSGLSTTLVADGRWHHIAGVVNNNVWQIYVDGVLENSTTQAYANGNLASNQPLSIGSYTAVNIDDFYFSGAIDEVRLWRTALTAAQIRATMCQKIATAPAELVGYFRLDASSGNTAADVGSVPTNGSILGTSNWATSGAALGDQSVSAYPSSSPGSVSLSLTAASGDVATVSGLSNGAQGVQFYAINSAPNTSPSTGAASTYFGVFTTPATSTYTFALQPQNSVSVNKSLYRRADAASAWALSAPTRSTTTLTLTGQSYRAEYILADPNVWTGAVSTDYNTPGNWSANAVPGAGDNVVIPAGAVRMPVLSGAAAAASFGVDAGASMTIASGGTLTLQGALVNNGTFSGGGALSMRGTGGSARLAGTSPVRIGDLSVGGSAAAIPQSLTVETPLTVSRVLTLFDNLLMSGNGALTLASDAAGTAMVVNNGSAAVIGAVTVQRYLDGARNAGPGYRHLSAPVTNTTLADLATAAFSPVVNPDYNTLGNTVRPFPTVFGYDQARVPGAGSSTAEFDRGWTSPGDLGETMTPGRGYTVNMTADQTVDFVGTLGNGNLTVNGLSRGAGPQAGWQLLGNPYPAPVNFTQLTRSGLDNAVYVFKSGGQYAGNYQSYVNGVANPSTPDNVLPLLPMGQAFFVRTSAPGTTGSLGFSNAARLTSYQNLVVQRSTAENRTLLRLQLRGGTAIDEAVVYLQNGATAGFDGDFDAYKVSQGASLSLAVQQDAELPSIRGISLLGAAPMAVPLAGRVPQAGPYTLQAAELLNLPAGISAYLLDAQTGAVVDLRQQPNYQFTTTGSSLAGRFSVQFTAGRPTATTSRRRAELTLYPNPARRELWLQLPAAAQAAEMVLFNSLGQLVLRQPLSRSAEAQRLALPVLAPGVYTVRVALSDGVVTKQLVIE